MATSTTTNDEVEPVTCIICHEMLRDPVTLQCGHACCTECITASSHPLKETSVPESVADDTSIPCPNCLGVTENGPVDEWSGDIETGSIAKNMVDNVVTDESDEDDKVCTPCREGGETVTASVWCCDCEHGLCSECEKYHKRLPLSKDHQMVPLSDFNRNIVPRKTRKWFVCLTHPDAEIDMMCEDCDVAVCHRCCILHHRKCESINTLEESLPKLKSVIEAHEKELAANVAEVTQELSVKKTIINDIDKELEEAFVAIDTSGETVIAEVRAQQRQLKLNVLEAKHEAMQGLRADVRSGEMRLEVAKQRLGLIQQAMASDIIMKYFEMYKMCKTSVVKKTEENIPYVERKPRMHMKIEDNSDKIVSYIIGKPVATLRLIEETPSPVGSQSKPTLVRTIDTALKDIWDVMVATVKGIKTVIVASRDEHIISSFYEKQGELCTSNLKLTGSAFNITKISADTLAIAIHSASQIEFVCVTPDVQHQKTVTTSKQYFGLACLNSSRLIAGSQYTGAVDIIDMSGSVLKTFKSATFTDPVYLTINKDIIIVSDYMSKSVTGISQAGVLKFKYPRKDDRQLANPWGVSHSRSGEVFVADEESHTVVQLTGTGKFVRDILTSDDGVRNPRAVYVDDDNLIYVSIDHRAVYVYKFS